MGERDLDRALFGEQRRGLERLRRGRNRGSEEGDSQRRRDDGAYES
jgi:hypothetical protein